MERIMTKSKTVTTSEDIEDMRRLQEAWETTRQCMHICSRAGTRLDENSSTIDNYATGDAIQFMVSNSFMGRTADWAGGRGKSGVT